MAPIEFIRLIFGLSGDFFFKNKAWRAHKIHFSPFSPKFTSLSIFDGCQTNQMRFSLETWQQTFYRWLLPWIVFLFVKMREIQKSRTYWTILVCQKFLISVSLWHWSLNSLKRLDMQQPNIQSRFIFTDSLLFPSLKNLYASPHITNLNLLSGLKFGSRHLLPHTFRKVSKQ